MARVTVEDCAQVVSNRFELVVLASQRAKDISAGNPITLDRDNDKNVVVALREIAAKSISLDKLKDAVVEKHCRYAPKEEENFNNEEDVDSLKEIQSLMKEEYEMSEEEKSAFKSSPLEEDDDMDEEGLEDGPNFSDDNMDVED